MDRLLPVAIAMLVAAPAVPAHGAPEPDAIVTVRAYNYAGVTAEHLNDAKDEAGRTFRKAGVTLRWLDCHVGRSDNDDASGCMDALREGRDFILRLTATATRSDSRRVVALGSSMLDRDQRSGVLMTVDLFPIRAIAEGTGTGLALLLGRAMAHEIGHLLLGSSTHPREGLMRALWSYDELRGVKPAHWGFSPQEAARMRQGLERSARFSIGDSHLIGNRQSPTGN